MALKKNLNDDEKYGLTPEEVRLAEKYLRKHKTKGAIKELEAMKLYELFMIGCSFNEISNQFPQYTLGQVILTAALRGWCKDRERMQDSLRERMQARVVKSIIEQVEFITTMLSVTNAEHMSAMQNYILDPKNNPKPKLRIESIREYKELAKTFREILAATNPNKNANLLDALKSPSSGALPSGQQADDDDHEEDDDEYTLDDLIEEDKTDE